MSPSDLLDAICRNVISKPLVSCSWRDLLRLRDHVASLLDAEIDRLQFADLPAAGNPPVTSPPAVRPRA